MDAETSGSHVRAVAERAVDFGHGATVKPLYGHQEQAVVGYNPGKPGRPSHVYHCYFIAAIRLILEVEVQAGNRTASQYAQPGLWAWLDARPREQWPRLLRGDLSWGTERMMQQAEERGLPYLSS